MYCSNCGKQIENEAKFCSSCGEKQESNVEKTLSAVEPLAEDVQPQKEKNISTEKNKKIKKVIMWSSIGLGIALVITAIIVFFTVFFPQIQENNKIKADFAKADALFEQGKYEEAFAIYRAPRSYDITYSSALPDYAEERGNECIMIIINNYLTNGEYMKAYEKIEQFRFEYRDSSNELLYGAQILKGLEEKYGKPSISESDYPIIYNAICEMFSLDDKWNKSDISISGTYIDVGLYYISLLPITYKDVSSIKIIFDDLKLKEIRNWKDNADYIDEHRELIYSLWKYKTVRSIALEDNTIYTFMLGFWSEHDYPYIRFYENEDDGGISAEYKGLSYPNVNAKYYEIRDCVFVYTNSYKGEPLCNVFKFTFDEIDPCKMTLYSYEDGKTYTMTRWNQFEDLITIN